MKIHPESQSRRYVDWLENIRPWCISRQLWWGHQLPVWYRGEDETHVGMEPPEGEGWTREEDVLDTWFSSALWPFATLGWPEQTPDLRAFYPTDVLSTARDILFLWVARMVMMGLRFAGDIPFDHVYVHSVIQAPDGRRMSKSLGTGIDPLEEIDRHGADAVRFGLLAMSSTQDVRYSTEKVEQGQALATKLFNASRFVLMNVEPGAVAAPRPTAPADRWILSRLQHVIGDTSRRIDEFEFAKAALGLYDFVYGELCDWYLELVKGREMDADLSATLLHVLRETLALAHPVIPFVTEAVWDTVPDADGLLAGSPFPQADPALVDPAAEARDRRRHRGRPQRARVAQRGGRARRRASCPRACAADGLRARPRRSWRGSRGSTWRPARPTTRRPRRRVVVPGGTVELLPAPGVDPAEQERKLAARRGELEAEIARAEGKLANQGFVAKAPPELVASEREKLERLVAELASL